MKIHIVDMFSAYLWSEWVAVFNEKQICFNAIQIRISWTVCEMGPGFCRSFMFWSYLANLSCMRK